MTVRPDNRLADAPMAPVSCRRCAATVLVRKSSREQTSVQWDADGWGRCAERRDADAIVGGRHGLFLACTALRESILAAVRAGAVALVDADGAEV